MKLEWKKLPVYLATLGPIGHFTAPGTVATLVTIPGAYWLQRVAPTSYLYLGALILIFVTCFTIVSYAVPFFQSIDDPSEIVLDEVIGCLIVFWSIPLNTKSIIVGFVLFRILDIFKFGWIKKVEKLSHAWGIMADDIVAAIISNIVLRILFITS